jgi:hypothetical protein
MTAANQNPENDSLIVTENGDGTFTVEWDPEDPKYSMFNHLTEEEMNVILTKAIEHFIKNDES